MATYITIHSSSSRKKHQFFKILSTLCFTNPKLRTLMDLERRKIQGVHFFGWKGTISWKLIVNTIKIRWIFHGYLSFHPKKPAEKTASQAKGQRLWLAQPNQWLRDLSFHTGPFCWWKASDPPWNLSARKFTPERAESWVLGGFF